MWFLENVITMSDEKRLIKKLLDDYETVGVVGRPVYNTSQTISVSYGLSLIQILDLDEKNQVLTTNVWSKYAWVDLLLRWKPEDYGSINLVRVPSSKIWTPDIVLYNYADTRLKEHREALVLVESTGEVRWLPQAIFKSTCNIDITNFPFDVQKCSMKFGSWTYDGFKLDVNFLDQKDQFDISDYVRSNEWELLEYPAVKHTIYYYGLDEPYPDLTFYVVIKRVAVFYNYILVLPCVLLSFLTLVIFWLPPESPAKVMIGMSVFVAFFVLLLLLADSTPPAASSIPLIGAYFCANMILITLSTFLAVIIIQNHVRGDRKNKVPNWLKRIAIDGMARVLCMSEFLDKDAQKTSQQRSNSKGHSKDEQVQGRTAYHHQPQSTGTLRPSEGRRSMFKPPTAEEGSAGMIRGQVSIFPQQQTGDQPPFIHPQHFQQQQQQQQQQQLTFYQHQPTLDSTNPVYMVGCSPALENDVKEIRKMLKAYITRLENKDASAKHAKEWRLVARVLDRIFFYAYIGTIIVSLCTIFPREMSDFQRIGNSTVGPTTESPVTSHL